MKRKGKRRVERREGEVEVEVHSISIKVKLLNVDVDIDGKKVSEGNVLMDIGFCIKQKFL